MIVIYADGIGTSKLLPGTDGSILWPTVQRLASLRGARPVRVEWPASIGPIGGNLSWTDATRIGMGALDRILADHPGEPVVLLGYSGGCKVVHDWLDARHGQLGRIAAVGLMSDPFRPWGKYQHGTPLPPGRGILKPRPGPIPGRTFWSAWPGDVITDCPDNSPLRTVADLSKNTPGGVLDDLGDHLHLNSWQLANYMEMWRRDPLGYLFALPSRIAAAREGIHGYLNGEHTLAYTRPWGPDDDRRSYAHRLADTINYGLGVRGHGRSA